MLENVLTSFKHECKRLTLSSRFDVITDVIKIKKMWLICIWYFHIWYVKLQLY